MQDRIIAKLGLTETEVASTLTKAKEIMSKYELITNPNGLPRLQHPDHNCGFVAVACAEQGDKDYWRDLYKIGDPEASSMMVFRTDGIKFKLSYPIYIVLAGKGIYGVNTFKGLDDLRLVKMADKNSHKLLNYLRFSSEDIIKYLVKDFYLGVTFEVKTLKEGYDHCAKYSCMRGKGDFFNLFEGKAFYVSMRRFGFEVGKAVIWKAGEVFKTYNDEPLGLCADRLYYVDGEHHRALHKYLKEAYEGITFLWGGDNEGEKINYRSYYIYAPDGLGGALAGGDSVCWQDTFNHYICDDGLLYSFNWREEGHQPECFKMGGYGDYVLLQCEGGAYSYDDLDLVYSEYEDRSIPRDYAVWSNIENSWISDGNSDFVYIGSVDDYYLKENCVYINYANEWVLRGEVIYSARDGALKEDDAVYSEYYGDYLHVDSSVYVAEIDDYVTVDDDVDAVIAEFQDEEV